MQLKYYIPIFLSTATLAAVLAFPNPASAATCTTGQSEIAIQALRPDGSAVASARVAAYTQTTKNGSPALGTELSNGRTSSDGKWSTCVATAKAPFAVNAYVYSAIKGNLTLYQEQLTATPTGFSGIAKFGQMSVAFRDPNGQVIRNKTFSLYVQSLDASQRPILNNSALIKNGFTTGSQGRTDIVLGPGTYVLRVAGSYAKFPIILANRKIESNVLSAFDEPLSALDITILDGSRVPVTRHPISIHTEIKNSAGSAALGVPLTTSLKTDKVGRAIVYVPAGTYVTTTRGSFKQFTFRKYSLAVNEKTVTPVAYRLSGLRILLRHGNGDLVIRGGFSLHEQQTAPDGTPSIATTIAKNRNIGDNGYGNYYVPNGTYIIDAAQGRFEQIEVYPEKMTRIDIPRDVTYQPDDFLTLKTPLTNLRLTVRPTTTAKGIKNIKRPLRKTYRVRAATFAAPYTVIFSMTGREAEALGVNPAKVRIAFYQDSKKSWRLYGRYDAARKHVSAVVAGSGLVTIVEVP